MFVSPTEPKPLREIGITAQLPEDYGVDFLFHSKLGTVGVQRKVFPSDFLSSMKDDRLNKEFLQMKALDVAILLLEGRQQWTTDGELYGAYGNSRRSYIWTRTQHRNYIASVQMRGILVQESDSIDDTISYLRGLQLWADKDDHTSLDRRAAVKGDMFYTPDNADYLKWIYQTFPGVGPKSSAILYSRLGNIFRLKVTAEDIAGLPGFGKARANKIMEIFGNAD